MIVNWKRRDNHRIVNVLDIRKIKMGVAPKDAIIPEKSLSVLTLDKHIDFIANYETNKNTKYEYSMSESLRMSGIYWASTALDIMNASDRMEENRVRITQNNDYRKQDVKSYRNFFLSLL